MPCSNHPASAGRPSNQDPGRRRPRNYPSHRLISPMKPNHACRFTPRSRRHRRKPGPGPGHQSQGERGEAVLDVVVRKARLVPGEEGGKLRPPSWPGTRRRPRRTPHPAQLSRPTRAGWSPFRAVGARQELAPSPIQTNSAESPPIFGSTAPVAVPAIGSPTMLVIGVTKQRATRT